MFNRDLNWLVFFAIPAIILSTATSLAQTQKLVSCLPVASRTQPEGCWILVDKPLGKLSSPVLWTLDTYPTQESAEQAGTANSAVVQALDKFWLFTIGEKPAPPTKGIQIT